MAHRPKRSIKATQKTCSEDFLEWNALEYDLGDLLGGEFTCGSDPESDISDVDFELAEGVVEAEENIKECIAASAAYKCPDCSKMYKSIAGFRGHALRKHSRNKIKGMLFSWSI